MAILRDDMFTRRGVEQPRRRHVSALAVILLFVSIALLVLSRIDHPVVKTVRDAANPFFGPVLNMLSAPLAPIRNLQGRIEELFVPESEFERLRAENQALKGWEWRARDLERQLTVLTHEIKLVQQPETKFITARVIADSTGPFVRSVIIDAGREQGLKVGFAVINADGLVGRLVDVAEKSARVLLVSDINSRIPVSIGANADRAIAVGNNGSVLELKHLPKDVVPEPGVVVATSGRGGLFPPSLRIGEIETSGGRVSVRPFANLERLEFLSVLLFESPVQPFLQEFSAASPQQKPEGGQ